MRFPRSSGVLLHPTSLPGRFGIGDLGPRAHEFVDFLAEAGQRWWQVLPLGPTGAMNSPYQSHSSFAGNPLLISPDTMVKDGLLHDSDLPDSLDFPVDRVAFSKVAELKESLLRRAFEQFDYDQSGFQEFLTASSKWLDDYALFMALKEHSGGKPWFAWESALVQRKPAALARWRDTLATSIRYHQFVQYVFETQFQLLRKTCSERSVRLVGDIPIFVAHDSADVWARPDLFFLDKNGRASVVAGVPPDYFSETGQLWGNPLYRWDLHAADGFSWWIDRLGALLRWVDMIRIDHFRGFEAYWEVPGKAKTAAKGRWVPGPGAAFFRTLQQRFAELPVIAEDLGLITPAVEALRDEFQLPGMRVLQFGFSTDAEAEKHLPHRFAFNCVVYTGTHDNDTSVGWLTSSDVHTTQSSAQVATERAYALRYLGTDGKEFSWDMIRLALGSLADIAIVPMQDILGLDGSARMNVPGQAEGNWGWRFRSDAITPDIRRRLAELTATYSRWNGLPPADLDPHHVPSKADRSAGPATDGRTTDGSTAPTKKSRAKAGRTSSGDKAPGKEVAGVPTKRTSRPGPKKARALSKKSAPR